MTMTLEITDELWEKLNAAALKEQISPEALALRILEAYLQTTEEDK